jgi:tripartite ATP-independent transporter DctP family solute receptor
METRRTLLTKSLALGLTAAATASLVRPARAQQTTLKLGEIYPESHSNSRGAMRFAELVADKTGGQVKVEVFPDSKLGSERELAEGVVAGTIDIAPSGLGGIGRFIQPIHALELPYLYKDLDHLSRVAEALMPDLDKVFAEKNLKVLGYVFLGPRNLAARKPVRAIEDLKGLKLRVPESPLYVGMARALGATPTPVAFPETYTSLQTGVVDGAEGDPAALYTTKWYEPAKYITQTEHIWHLRYVVMNGAAYARLAPYQQKALIDAAQEAKDFQLQAHKEGNKEALDKMQAAGATLIPIANRAPFAKALEKFNRDYAEKLGKTAVALLDKANSVQ